MPALLSGAPLPPVLDGLTGYYHGGSFDAEKQLWADVSGQLNHASTGGNISRIAGGINGRDYIAGPTTGYVWWPQVSCAAGREQLPTSCCCRADNCAALPCLLQVLAPAYTTFHVCR